MTQASDFKQNLESIKIAADIGQLSVVELQDKATGKIVFALTGLNEITNGFHVEYELIPYAIMIEGNPYDQYNPPNPAGGFYTD